ncbi:UNVERIFIED_CONTAM: hypothetical protein GTU68_002006, partial [Idotea baltica]|nr:hypothetical protein [Idotea baltica]
MNGAKSFGFCDLNISTEGDVRETAIQALKLGYKVIALNTEISDEIIVTKRNKKGTYTEIPPPIKFTLTKEELKKNGLIQEPKILSRITIKFSQPSSPFIHKSRDAILKYDLIAYKPLTEAAFKHLCQSNVDVDMISFDTSDSLYRPSRKLLNLAVKSDVYFELCYGPCLRSASCRLKTIQLWHDMHRLFRC